MNRIRVLLADDHALLRSGLRLLINTQPDMDVVGDVGDMVAAREATLTLKPDVLTLDLSMAGGNAMRLIETLSREATATRILVVTMHDDPAHYRMAIAAGAVGYVVKSAADDELLTAIRAVAAGRPYACIPLHAGSPPEADHVRPTSQTLADLSSREREVLRFLAQGHTNQAIADRLFLSVKTVESYRARMLAKLGLHSRAELTQFALSIGLLDTNSPTG